MGHAMGHAVGGAAAAGEGDVSGGGAPKKGPLQNSPLPKGTARASLAVRCAGRCATECLPGADR
eukprot:scaffold31897_cov58-Phaeocystis_antarctica.AAC.4